MSGNLDTFPATGTSAIYKITPQGHISTYATGFNMVLGVQFDHSGGLYVLESTTGNTLSYSGTGDVIRIDPDGFAYDDCLQTEPGNSYDLRS